MALTIAVQDEIVQRTEEAQRLRHLHVERAHYEADLAQRRYLKADPDNRLVMTVLRARNGIRNSVNWKRHEPSRNTTSAALTIR
jgi:hypothetical protein